MDFSSRRSGKGTKECADNFYFDSPLPFLLPAQAFAGVLPHGQWVTEVQFKVWRLDIAELSFRSVVEVE